MDKEKISKFIKRYKYLVYILIGALGACFILIVCTNSQIKTNTYFYDIGIGIGCSVVASVIVTMILLVLIPDDYKKESASEEWGLIKIYNTRSEIKIGPDNLPEHTLDFIAFGLSDFRKANQDIDKIASKIIDGLHIRVLTINPRSNFVKEQGKVENNKGIQEEILELIKWGDDIKKEIEKKGKSKKGSITIKLYNSLPFGFYCRADGDIYTGAYMPDMSSGKNITYHFKAKTKGGKYYSSLFEKIWKGNRNIIPAEAYKEYFLMDQAKSIETVMKYFCDLFQGGHKEPVIGVVTIFKHNYRKTFFSCNKEHDERHEQYEKTAGTVGEMIKLNEEVKSEKNFLLCDYKNKLAFVQTYRSRSYSAKKIENKIPEMGKKETIAILAAPLIVEKELVGALTFDFVKLPKEYVSNIGQLRKLECNKEIKGECKTLLTDLFRTARECEKIIVNLLGQEAEVQYKNMYEEEWS